MEGLAGFGMLNFVSYFVALFIPLFMVLSIAVDCSRSARRGKEIVEHLRAQNIILARLADSLPSCPITPPTPTLERGQEASRCALTPAFFDSSYPSPPPKRRIGDQVWAGCTWSLPA
jgi:hypothetical protein